MTEDDDVAVLEHLWDARCRCMERDERLERFEVSRQVQRAILSQARSEKYRTAVDIPYDSTLIRLFGVPVTLNPALRPLQFWAVTRDPRD